MRFFTNYCKNHQKHVNELQECHFLRIKKAAPNDVGGEGIREKEGRARRANPPPRRGAGEFKSNPLGKPRGGFYYGMQSTLLHL
jgi:hypothetical protein